MRKLLLVLGLFLISACGQLDVPAIKIANTPVPGVTTETPSMDAIEIDQAGHRLYAADRSNQGVDVFDVSAGSATYLTTIAMPSEPNGLALAPDLSRLFVGVGNGSVVFVDINPRSPTFDKVTNEVKTGAKSVDLIDYSADRHLVYASNGVQGTIASIDSGTGEIKAQFKVGFALEQPRFNPADGMLYVTSPDADSLFRLDPNDGTIKKRMFTGGCGPTGLAINPKSNQAVMGCRKMVISYDLRRDTMGEKFYQQPGGDIVSYDAKVDRFFVAAPYKPGNGAVAMFGGTPVAFITTVITRAGGKSAAYDEVNDMVYTPDTRPSKAGVASFKLPAGGQALPPLSALIPFGVLLAVIALLFAVVGRNADPVRREEPTQSRVRHNRVT